MARLREAIGGAVLPARIALSAELFQSVTTSAWARVLMRSTVETEPERSLKLFIKATHTQRSPPWPGRSRSNQELTPKSSLNLNKNQQGQELNRLVCPGQATIARKNTSR